MSRILVVEDSESDRRLIRSLLSKQENWSVVLVNSAECAVGLLDVAPVDLALCDIRLPGEDGFSLLATIRGESPRLPVIIMSGVGDEELAMRALEEGAAAYLPKRELASRLISTVEKSLGASRRQWNRQRLFAGLESSRSRFALSNDPAMIPTIIDHLQASLETYRICNDNEVMRVGIALEEALANAIYHGNLELRSELKERPGNAFQEEAQRRMQLDPYRQRRIFVEEIMSRGEARFVIRDEGRGFSPAALPDPTDLEWLSKPHGRGVMMMRSFMDDVIYNDKGNEVTLVMRARPQTQPVPAARAARLCQPAGAGGL